MNMFVAMGVGYLLGAKTGGEDLDKLGRSVKTLCKPTSFLMSCPRPGRKWRPRSANWHRSSTASGHCLTASTWSPKSGVSWGTD